MDFPYSHGTYALNVEIDRYSIDGTDDGTPDSSRVLTLTGWADWTEVDVDGTVRLTREAIERGFPEEERADPPARLLLVEDRPQTHDRGAVSVLATRDELVPGETYRWSRTLTRADTFGQVKLTPVLVRTRDGGGPPGVYAWVEDQEVADGAPVSIVADEVEQWLDGNMDVEIKPFSKTGAPEGNLFSLEKTTDNKPKLWINSELDLVANLLQSRVPAGPKADFRDGVAAQLAHPVWLELVLWTASDIDLDGKWNSDWQEAVLESIVQPMFGVDSPEDAAEQLRDFAERESLDLLIADLNEHLQQQLDEGPKLADLVATRED